MQHDMLYVALTRTSKEEYVNFCEIDFLKPYVGYIYRYSHNGKSYIGSTVNIKRRKEDHKTNTTNKFGRAIQRYGYKQFKFEIIDTIQFSDTSELHDLETSTPLNTIVSIMCTLGDNTQNMLHTTYFIFSYLYK